jgi:transcription-repair coupling factor (superfamily II helicase)
MQWTAKYFDNVYLLTDEHPNLTTDLVVYVLPEDKTVVIDHEAINHEVMGERTKVLWCYEPGRKLAGKTTFVWMPYVMSVSAQTITQDLVPVQPMMGRYSEIEVNEDFYLPINGYAT